MLLIFLYHRIGTGKHSNSYQMLFDHFTYLKEHYSVVLPGDPLEKGKISVCLTFDDATFDFYHYVYPLLKKMQLRALLGIPVRYILEKTSLTPEERLSIPYPLMMQDGFFDQKAPFCTWQELREMVESGYVEAASHSFSHGNLTFPFINLEKEVITSKKILEDHLPQPISSFIYPFGRCNPQVHKYVSKFYPYVFRIGSAGNTQWNGKNPLTRIPADQLVSPYCLTSPFKILRYRLKQLL